MQLLMVFSSILGFPSSDLFDVDKFDSLTEIALCNSKYRKLVDWCGVHYDQVVEFFFSQ